MPESPRADIRNPYIRVRPDESARRNRLFRRCQCLPETTDAYEKVGYGIRFVEEVRLPAATRMRLDCMDNRPQWQLPRRPHCGRRDRWSTSANAIGLMLADLVAAPRGPVDNLRRHLLECHRLTFSPCDRKFPIPESSPRSGDDVVVTCSGRGIKRTCSDAGGDRLRQSQLRILHRLETLGHVAQLEPELPIVVGPTLARR